MGSGPKRGLSKPSQVTPAELITLTKNKPEVPTHAGAQPGDSGEHVKELQTYLARFGYLPSPVLEHFGIEMERAAAPAFESGKFEDSTRQALERFQEFNHLPVTGILDEDTVAVMHRPRCGFPDVAEFVLQGNKWTTTALTYGFQEFTPDLNPAQIRSAVQQALAQWSAVTPLTFSEVPFASNPDMKIRFVGGDHGDGSPFDGPSGILAHGSHPPPKRGRNCG